VETVDREGSILRKGKKKVVTQGSASEIQGGVKKKKSKQQKRRGEDGVEPGVRYLKEKSGACHRVKGKN